jgi:hypothetical protein
MIQQEIMQLQESIDRESHHVHSHPHQKGVEIIGHEPSVHTSSTPSLPKTKSQLYLHTLKSSSQHLIDLVMKSAIRKVVPMTDAATLIQSNSTNNVGHSSSASSLTSLKKVLGFTSAVAIEPMDTPTEHTTEQSHQALKKQFAESHGILEAKESTSKPGSSGFSSPSPTTRKRTASSNSQGGEKEELSFKLQAQATQNKYNVAVAEHALQTDRKKNAASEKLALRLQLKKKLQQGDSDDPLAPPVSTPTTSVKAGELTEQQLHELKAEKLKQHKMQEARRHQSMAIAQKRSAEALQKRLEDIANKKRMAESGGTEEGRGRTISMAIEEGDEEVDAAWEDGGEGEMD